MMHSSDRLLALRHSPRTLALTVSGALVIASALGLVTDTSMPTANAGPNIPCSEWQQMHPGWPCVDVPDPPTPPPGPPSTPSPLPTPAVPGQPQTGNGGGTNAGALTPPPVGPGNGTPIVPVPGQPTIQSTTIPAAPPQATSVPTQQDTTAPPTATSIPSPVATPAPPQVPDKVGPPLTVTPVKDQTHPPGKAMGDNGPWVNWGWVTGHVYFSKEDTRKMAASAAAAMAIAPFWLLVPPPFGEAIAAWWMANSMSVTIWATAAVAQNKCLALKIGATGSITKYPPSIGVSPEHYSEGCI